MDRLRAEHITKSFDGTTIIQDVSLTLHEDELICLLGVSGVGKSTFFNVLSGLVVPDSGRVLLGEEDITGQTGRISYMQQKDLLLPHKRIVDNIALPLVLKGVPRKQARQQVSSGLAEFGLEGTERKYPGQLSGGMRQRAALYRTYLFNSEVALLDEPFSAVDAITKSQLHLWYLEMMSSCICRLYSSRTILMKRFSSLTAFISCPARGADHAGADDPASTPAHNALYSFTGVYGV